MLSSSHHFSWSMDDSVFGNGAICLRSIFFTPSTSCEAPILTTGYFFCSPSPCYPLNFSCIWQETPSKIDVAVHDYSNILSAVTYTKPTFYISSSLSTNFLFSSTILFPSSLTRYIRETRLLIISFLVITFFTRTERARESSATGSKNLPASRSYEGDVLLAYLDGTPVP